MPQYNSRSGKSLLIVLIPVLIALGAVSAWFYLQPSTQPSLDAGRAAADAFLGLIHSGAAESAWESTTAEYKSAVGRQAFVTMIKATPALKEPSEFITVETVTVQDQPRSELLYREPKSGKTVRLVLANEAGEWRIDRLIHD